MKFLQKTYDVFIIRLGELTIFIFITIIIILLFELISWNILNIRNKIVRNPQYEDNELEISYKTKDIDSIKKMLSETWGRNPMYRREPFVEFVEKKYPGKYVTISPYGFRNVKDQETHFLNRNKYNIFVFGGSTTFGYGVNNNETIPSYLQELLNKRYNNNIAIYNFGCGCHYSSQERIWFEQFIVNGIIPDMVIFIDGLNDFYYSNMKDKSNFSDRIVFIGDISIINIIVINIVNKSPTITLFREIVNKLYRRDGQENLNVASDNEIRRAAYRLSTNRQIIRNICKEIKIAPIFVQQPVPTYNYNNKRAVPVNVNNLGKFINSKKGYEIMIEQVNSGKIIDEDIVWCQNIEIDSEQYVDAVHYSPKYNFRLAIAIADYINTKNIIRNH
jgi:lysophospholipase L1-like esterase